MEAPVFTGWIYDHLQPHAGALKAAHALMLRVIAAAKKKNDRIDASKICDGPRSGEHLPSCKEAGGLPAYPAAQKIEFVFFLPVSSDRTSALWGSLRAHHRLAWTLGSRPIFHFFGKGVNRFSGPDR
jgi:hypothetical protein